MTFPKNYGMANCNHRGVGVELRNVKRQCQSITDIAMKVPQTSFFSRCALSINTLNIPWCINLHFGFNLGEMLSMPQTIVSKQLNSCLGVWFWLKSLPLVGYAMDYVMSFGFDHLSALFHVFHTSVLLPVWRSKIISKLNMQANLQSPQPLLVGGKSENNIPDLFGVLAPLAEIWLKCVELLQS
jgi:hypothetical protein